MLETQSYMTPSLPLMITTHPTRLERVHAIIFNVIRHVVGCRLSRCWILMTSTTFLPFPIRLVQQDEIETSEWNNFLTRSIHVDLNNFFFASRILNIRKSGSEEEKRNYFDFHFRNPRKINRISESSAL